MNTGRANEGKVEGINRKVKATRRVWKKESFYKVKEQLVSLDAVKWLWVGLYNLSTII